MASVKNMKLFSKMLLISIVPLVLLGAALQIINYVMSEKNFGELSKRVESTLNQISQDSITELSSVSEQSARDLLQEIRIAIGGSLQPGEAAKFLNLAKQQVTLEQLKEFSFYGPDGTLELSSNEATTRRTVPADILQQARSSQNLIAVGNDEKSHSLCFYQPLFVDMDMHRMNPEYQIGQMYGMLFVEMSKDRILSSIQKQRERITTEVNDHRIQAESVLARNFWTSLGVEAAFLAVTALLIIPIAQRTVVRPMRKAISANQEIAEFLSSAADQFSSASESIAHGANEQAAGLRETSSSLDEMTSMTKNNADNASHANQLASEARQVAQTGVAAIQTMSEAMKDIQTSADTTARIIKVIDEIAFQTNLLALNAAVEAARAGEAGKGFAVVAEEVRNLAMRSAEAAKETAGMIQASVQQAQKGVEISNNVNKTLSEIADRVSKTADIVNEITTASQEQAQTIEQINTAITQMDAVTQQNAANSEETASSARELNYQSLQLKKTVDDLIQMVGASTSAGVSHRRTVHAASAARLQNHEQDSLDDFEDSRHLDTVSTR
jgi:methyl-accepting chemotaxis protein